MKRTLLLFICLGAFVFNVFSDELEGRWKSGETIFKIKKSENDQSKLKIVIIPTDDNARSYIETERIEYWSDGINKKYKLKAKANTWNSNLPNNIEINYAVTKRGTGLIGVVVGNHTYAASRISERSQQGSSTQGSRLMETYRRSQQTNTVNQTATQQSNINGNNNNSTNTINGNNNQTIIINNYR